MLDVGLTLGVCGAQIQRIPLHDKGFQLWGNGLFPPPLTLHAGVGLTGAVLDLEGFDRRSKGNVTHRASHAMSPFLATVEAGSAFDTLPAPPVLLHRPDVL